MARLARAEVFDPAEVEVAHVYSRTVRRCFLFGDDPVTGKNFDHRKLWIEKYLQQCAAAFGIELLAYAILSNHFHLILRSRPDVVATWNDREVARRWMLLCPLRRQADGSPAEPSEQELKSIAGCPERCAEIRQRLSNISWWMRLLCQHVATRANREEDESGRFFQDRYKATKLVDEASLLACAAYVDLNPIRAAIAETIEASDFTSVQRRMQEAGLAKPSTEPEGEASEPQTASPCRDFAATAADSFLSPLSIDEANDPVGPYASTNDRRCSDKGFLPISLVDYVQLLDWTARQVTPGKRGNTPPDVPPILQRLGLDQATWCELVSEFGKLFCTVAGRTEVVDSLRSLKNHRRFHLRRRARELMTSN